MQILVKAWPGTVLAVLCLWIAQIGAAAEYSLTAPNSPDALEKDLRNASLVLALQDNQDATAQDMLAAAQSEYANLLGVLYNNGFFGPVISVRIDGREASQISPLERVRAPARIRVNVNAGPLFQLGKASIAPLAPETTLPDAFVTGEPAQVSVIREAVAEAIDTWREAGHAKAAVAQQLVFADHRRERLDVEVTLEPGRRFRFGDLIVTGKTNVREERIRAIAGLPKNKVFSQSALDQSAERLRRTGVFRSVLLREEDDPGASPFLDIEAALVDQKPRRLGYGVEYSTLDGVALSAYWMHRNLLGGAERLRFDGQIGGIGGQTGGEDMRLSVRFDRPATFTPDTQLFLYSSLEDVEEPDYAQRLFRLGAGLSHRFSQRIDGEAAIEFRQARVEDDLGDRDLTHLLLPLALRDDLRDSDLNTTKGHFLELTATPFVETDSSEIGMRFGADARYFRRLRGDDGLIAALRLQAGGILGAETEFVPPDFLFYSGGAGTVRGQPYQSLAVTRNGDTFGGSSFLGFSAELRARLRDKIGLVLFYDAGFVGEEELPTGTGEWHSGAGVGLRYDTGIGPIRVDLGVPVSGDTGDGLQLYIGIGQAF